MLHAMLLPLCLTAAKSLGQLDALHGAMYAPAATKVYLSWLCCRLGGHCGEWVCA